MVNSEQFLQLLNTSNGPVFIDDDVEICDADLQKMPENVVITGAFRIHNCPNLTTLPASFRAKSLEIDKNAHMYLDYENAYKFRTISPHYNVIYVSPRTTVGRCLELLDVNRRPEAEDAYFAFLRDKAQPRDLSKLIDYSISLKTPTIQRKLRNIISDVVGDTKTTVMMSR